jgi:hypothetical protein
MYLDISRENRKNLGKNYWIFDYYDYKEYGFNDELFIYKSSNINVYEKIILKGNIILVGFNDDIIICAVSKKDLKFDFLTSNYDEISYYIIDKKSDLVKGPFDTYKYNIYKLDYGNLKLYRTH